MQRNTRTTIRVAYVVSHPIQYQAPLLRHIARDPEIDLTVFFCSDFSVAGYKDEGFGVAVKWDVPLLEGYRSVVLPRLRDTNEPSPTRPVTLGFFRHFRRGVDGQPFDAVWVHGYSSLNSLHAMLAARALGLPVLLRSDSWLRDRARSGSTLLAKRVFFRMLRSMADGVLAVGTRNEEYWRHYFGKDFPIFLLPYAVDNDYFARETATASKSRGDLQAAWNLQPGRPVLLFASKLQERKLCGDLLEAYLQVHQTSGLHPYLVIVGDGEMRDALEQRAGESGCPDIRFAGFRNQSELPRFFDLSTVFVLPARHEPWGLVVNEAMAAGLPVIVSDDAGCAVDLVRQGENGFIYPVGDRSALRQAMLAILEPGRAGAMGARSREIVAHWSYAADAEGLRAALRHVTRKNLHAPAAA